MRKWGWVVLAVVAIGVVIAMASYQQYTPPRPAAAVPAATPAQPSTHTSSSQQSSHPATRHFHPFYEQHRGEVLRVSDYSKRARSNRIVALICFVVFAFLTLPKSARDIRAFYQQLVATRPLPAEAGEDDENNRRARKVLFFYLLFLLYQVVQFPLTWGRDNSVQFYSDLAFQTLLLLAVLLTFRSLKRGVALRWQDDPEARARMQSWLGAKLEGLTIRWRDMSRLALGMFVGAFTPALLAKLPDWLDVVASY